MYKIDGNGNILWKKEYWKPAFGLETYNAYELNNGDIVVVGQEVIKPEQKPRGFILRVNSAGDRLWMKRYEYCTSTFSEN